MAYGKFRSPQRVNAGWLVVLVLMAVMIAWPYCMEDYAAATVATLASLSALIGYRAGAAKILGTLVGASAGAYLGPTLFEQLESALGSHPFPLVAAHPIAQYAIGAFAGSLLLSLLFQAIVSAASDRNPAFATANSRVGFLFGSLQTAALCVFALGFAMALEPLAKRRLMLPLELDPQPVARKVAEGVVVIAASVGSRPYAPYLAKANPLEHWDALKKLTTQIAQVSDPEAIEAALKSDPQRWSQTKDVQAVLQQLKSSPEWKQVLTSAGAAIGTHQ